MDCHKDKVLARGKETLMKETRTSKGLFLAITGEMSIKKDAKQMKN